MAAEPGISIIVTVKNEEERIGQFLESLRHQEMPFEVVIVDSDSVDRTREIVLGISEVLPLNYIRMNCSRGKGRNMGAKESRYPYLLFLDGDCIADSNLLHNLRKYIADGYNLIAGKTVLIGPERFSKLNRVTLFLDNFEVTSPSSNLCYDKSMFEDIKGFNEIMVTAEDIDLNIRAIRYGARAAMSQDCLVKGFTRQTLRTFLKQGFWNGYGRGQLRLIHRKDWNGIRKGQIIGKRWTAYNFLRLSFGLCGYLYAILKRGKYPGNLEKALKN
jgi:glycosyltransferase involved in cell wall biosynthesis